MSETIIVTINKPHVFVKTIHRGDLIQAGKDIKIVIDFLKLAFLIMWRSGDLLLSQIAPVQYQQCIQLEATDQQTLLSL